MTIPFLASVEDAIRHLLHALNAQPDEQPRVLSAWHLDTRAAGAVLGADASGYLTVGAGDPGEPVSYVRFEASRATDFVRVHVQSSAAGRGGASYDPASFVTSDEVDCRFSRQQDRTVPRSGADHYYVWLIPVMKSDAGDVALFDGQAGRPDFMSFLDLGV